MPSRSTRALLIVTALVAGLLPAPAEAAHPGGCGGSWTGSSSCNFGLEGLPLRIGGAARTSSGTASIWVRATVTLTTGPQIVLECRATGYLVASCEEQLSTLGHELDAYTGVLPMKCRVSGASSGQFGCETPGTPPG